jgi:PAS domain S-box-containing protein
MNGQPPSRLIEVNREPDSAAGMSSRRLLAFLFPVLVAGTVTASAALIAAAVGFQREVMLLTAEGVSALLMLPTLLLVYREIADRRAAQRVVQFNAAALGRSESRLRGILESAMDAIITVDDNHHIVLFNKAAEAVFQCPRDEAVGAPLDRFIPERFRAGHRSLVRQFGNSGPAPRRMGQARVVRGLRRNGEEFPIEASISHVEEHGHRFFTVILRDVTERVRAEEALRRSKDEIQDLARAANSAREQEKSRIARELHDELGQALTALKIDVGWLHEHAQVPDPEVARKLAAMQDLLDDTVAATRRISSDLRPLMLDDLGLTAACEWLVQNFTTRTGIPCELALGTGVLDLPDPYATAVFRALQESLTNVAKHAQADRVEVTLERGADEIVLTVQDDGRGFDPAAPRDPASYGLLGLRERAHLAAGEIAIDSAPGRGTRIELRIPASLP